MSTVLVPTASINGNVDAAEEEHHPVEELTSAARARIVDLRAKIAVLEQELVKKSKQEEVSHARITELEAKVASLEKDLNSKRPATTSGGGPPPSSKKVKVNNGGAVVASLVSPIASAPSAKTLQVIKNRLKQSIKNSLKGVKFYDGWDVTDRKINVKDVLTVEEFHSVFNHGTLLQPTPDNKPNSAVWIKQLDSSDVEQMLGMNEFKGELWTKGGRPSRGGFFFGGGGFTKSHKIKGGVPIEISGVEVKFSSNNNTLLMKCTFRNKRMFKDVDSDEGDY